MLRYGFALAIIAITSAANACSVCFAHALGAALQGLGAQTLERHKTIVGFEFLSFNKSNAAETPGEREREHHREYVLSVFHGITDQWTVGANLPYIDNTIVTTGVEEDEHSRGLGDMIVGTIYQLKPSYYGNLLTAVNLNVKLPTGKNNSRDANGDLKEQHLQVGTGSTDVSGGASFTWEGSRHKGLWYSGFTVRVNGSNNRHFHYGNAFFYGFGYSHPIRRDAALAFELNGKVVAKDTQEDDSKDDNSGGHVLFGAINLRWPMANDIGLIVSYQHPLYQNLNGDQTEHGIFSLSVSRLF